MWRPESVQAQLAGNGRFPQVKKLPEGRGGGGGLNESWDFLVGRCRPVLQILALFQTFKCPFPLDLYDLYPISDLALIGRNYVMMI